MVLLFEYIKKFLNYSVCWTHMKNTFNGLFWAIKTVVNGEKNQKVAAYNFFVALFLDCLFGFILMQMILKITKPNEIVNTIVYTTDEGVVQLRSLINFLMGSPGGLKLNLPLSVALGRFFTYNTNLWWVFLDQCEPVLIFACHAIEWLGLFGITTHLAIISDILSLASFHAYCIYVYAARLFALQINGLVALWRLFIGRKWNPLRQCVDSCNYEPSQLFIGILTFTLLLFLLPTTLVYYLVFASLRLLFMTLEGLLCRLRTVLQFLPIVALTLWLFKANAICSNVSMHIVPASKNKNTSYELIMKPERSSLSDILNNVFNSVPIPKPPAIEWIKYFRNIITGTLF